MSGPDQSVHPTVGGRKRFYGRRRRKNPGRQALRKVNRIEKVLQRGQNLKSINTSIAASFAAGSSIQSLVTMNRGDTNYLREGDKITLKNMTWRIRLYLNNAETSPTAVRFVIVYDRRPNGAQAAVTDVLNSNTIDGLMNLSEDVRRRFQVIHDQFWQLSTGGNELAIEKGFKDLKTKKFYTMQTLKISLIFNKETYLEFSMLQVTQQM